MLKSIKNISKIVSASVVSAVIAGGSAIAAYTANYTSTDLDDIAIDNLGQFGADFKQYMTLLVLGFVAIIIVGYFVKIKKRVR